MITGLIRLIIIFSVIVGVMSFYQLLVHHNYNPFPAFYDLTKEIFGQHLVIAYIVFIILFLILLV